MNLRYMETNGTKFHFSCKYKHLLEALQITYAHVRNYPSFVCDCFKNCSAMTVTLDCGTDFISAIGNIFFQLHRLFCILVSAKSGSRIFHAHLKKVMLVI